MSTTSSFSKGCFVFKAKSKVKPRLSKKTKSSVKNSQPTKSPVGLFARNDPRSADARLQLYRQVWEAINKKSKDIISESHQQLFNEIKGFVSESKKSITNTIPTAIVSLGVNLPDHSSFFTLLELTLRCSFTPYIAMLNSKECPSLKHMIQKVVQKLTFMNCGDNDDEDEESEENAGIFVRAATKKTLAYLSSWYSKMQDRKPLLIIIEDLESFSTQQIQDFVLLCREYRVRDKLPFVLIMGLATTAMLQQQLHHRTSVCLATRSFQSQSSVVLLNNLIEKLIMDESVLKLGAKLMQQLLDGFLYHDLSLSSFMHRFHLIVMQHYISTPVSFLCCHKDQVSDRIKKLASDDLDLYRQLPSFMNFIESDRSKVVLLKDERQFRQFLLKSLFDLEDYSTNFSLYCRLVHTFSHGFPESLFGKTLREVYVTFLTNTAKEDWTQFIRLLNLSSAQELGTRIDAALVTLQSLPTSTSAVLTVCSKLVLFLEELKRLNEKEEVEQKSKKAFVPQGKKLDKFELKAQLMATAKDSRRTTRFDEIRKDIVAWMNEDLSCRLKPPSSVVFHEIFYAGSQVQSNWDIVSCIRRQVQPVPRVAISKALSSPSIYFGCQCCAGGDESSICPTMPDICIAYKLHVESGRLINLYDWMVSFSSIVSKENEGEEIEPVVQARFIRAVAQMQLLGFIQSSKKKTDHVARLTWGV